MSVLSPATAYELILKIRKGNPTEKTESIQKIPEISRNLGPERTIHELIPYIYESHFINESHWIKAIQSIASIKMEHYKETDFQHYLDKLSLFSCMESYRVRIAIADAYSTVCNAYKTWNIVSEIVSRMLNDDLATVRSTAVMIISSFVNVSPPNDFINKLIHEVIELDDQPPLVRQEIVRLAFSIVSKPSYPLDHNLSDLMNQYSQDSSPSVQCEVPFFFSKYLENGAKFSDIKFYVNEMAQNGNWRTRFNLITSIPDSFIHRGIEIDQLRDIVNMIINDPDNDVVVALAENLPKLAQIKGMTDKYASEIIDSLLPHSDVYVKSATIRSLPSFQKILGADFIHKSIMSYSTHESKNVVFSCFEAMNNLHDCDDIIHEEYIQRFDWRQKIELIPSLPKLLKNGNEFSKNIISLLLKDESISVRSRMVKELKAFIQNKHDVISILKSLMNDEDYQIRQTVIESFASIGENHPSLNIYVKDPVSNVRLVLVKCFPRFKIELKNDTDDDVREAALK